MKNLVRRGFYADSVTLMRISRELQKDGVEASLMIGTPSNKALLKESGLLSKEGAGAGPDDLIIAVKGRNADAALELAEKLLSSGSEASSFLPAEIEDANLALISVPGEFAAEEARRALERGLNVMVFSDNVPIEEEVALKSLALKKGLLMMGPDCGTALIAGTPIAFANAVPRGDIGIVSASGTGLQEVSCLLARDGRGVSHGIGVGGRDLSQAVGGRMTLAAMDALEKDAATKRIIVISKPPALSVTKKIKERAKRCRKPVTLCLLGAESEAVRTLEAAAGIKPKRQSRVKAKGNIRGLFCGGTLCAEAQFEFLRRDARVASNVPIPGASKLTAAKGTHTFVDLGDDDYTRGRPHPMIEPAVRDEPLAAALADPATGVVLLDVVLGWGGHMDPAGHLAATLKGRAQYGPAVIASVTGTEADPQVRSAQVAKLVAVGVSIAPSNAAAAQMAVACVTSS